MTLSNSAGGDLAEVKAARQMSDMSGSERRLMLTEDWFWPEGFGIALVIRRLAS
ncbi:MAG: hypothetical protein OXC63_11440 [Aestuariivita sp.]|nr:hypothetical protein [Aestuariivita sp.]MCY4346109.1 hypothetical protein [Aestuariivita sp.]